MESVIQKYPTLERLFGSLDFCECEHCRSIFGPAAYFVQLLEFLNPDAETWNQLPAANSSARPFDVLDKRRPDLQHIELSCDNTNTVLPYIDLVNEILEYYVVSGKLEAQVAHNVDGAQSAELIAEPQHVQLAAYATLAGKNAVDDAKLIYPIGLPFDLHLETTRALLERFSTSLRRGLEVYRRSDALGDDTTSGTRDVFTEILGLSRAERAIFTQPQLDLGLLYGLTDLNPESLLQSAKFLGRQLGVTYKELASLLSCQFINPNLPMRATLKKLSLESHDVFRFAQLPNFPPLASDELQAFETQLSELDAKARAWFENTLAAGEFGRVLVLADANGGCTLETTTLTCADGTAPEPLVFTKLALFVRLWRKLGWRIEDVDLALVTLLPGGAEPSGATALAAAFETALLYLAHVVELRGKLRLGKDALPSLLTFWADLPTAGPSSLYAKLFLSPHVQQIDDSFDDVLGWYLSTPDVHAALHLPGLQAALGMTAIDIGRVLEHTGTNLSEASLSLPLVSTLYRYGMLAEALKLKVADLLTLIRLTGIQPFEPLVDGLVTAIEADYPYSRTLRFVDVAQQIRESAFGLDELEFLVGHRFDPTGPFRWAAAPPMGFISHLGAELRGIRADSVVPDDPTGISDELLRSKLALVLSQESTDVFWGMWTGTLERTAQQDDVDEADSLDPSLLAVFAQLSVSYDPVRRSQHLSLRGNLDPALKTLIEAVANSAVLSALLQSIDDQARSFFEGAVIRRTLAPVGGFAESGDFETFFLGTSDAKRRGVLAARLFPVVQEVLIKAAVTRQVSAELGLDARLLDAMLSDGTLRDPAFGGTLYEGFAQAGVSGVSVEFYSTPDLTGDPPPSVSMLDAVDTAQRSASDATAQSVRFTGYLEVTADGPYRFFALRTNPATGVELRFADQPDVWLQSLDETGSGQKGVAELRAGVPYRFELIGRDLAGGELALWVQGETLVRGSVARLLLYSEVTVQRLHRALILLQKVSRISQAAELSPLELTHILSHPNDFGGLNLSLLPLEVSPPVVQTPALIAQIVLVLSYVDLRRLLGSQDADLIELMASARVRRPATANPAVESAAHFSWMCARLAVLLGVDPKQVTEAAKHLGYGVVASVEDDALLVAAPEFANGLGLFRLLEVIQLAESMGVAVDTAAQLIVSVPTDQTTRELRDALKARVGINAWLGVAQALFDPIRQRKRDALCKYLLHRLGYERIEQLYEHFLVDPGMEPVVQTSRLRLAIASVQLFVQRCLLGLERNEQPELNVLPGAIDGSQWLRLSQYRVNEAALRLLLESENYLVSALRPNKSHLFRQLEGAMSQDAPTDEAVETAFASYLSGLEEVARLEPVSSYMHESPQGDAIAFYVLGRTPNSPRKFFWRRYKMERGLWDPWEPVTTAIDGDHGAIAMWNDRLHVFWFTFVDKPVKARLGDSNDTSVTESKLKELQPVNKSVDLQLNWSEYQRGTWSPRQMTVLSNALHDADIPLDQYASEDNTVPGSDSALRPYFVYLREELSSTQSDGEEFSQHPRKLYVCVIRHNESTSDERRRRGYVLHGKLSPILTDEKADEVVPDLPIAPYDHSARGTTQYLGSPSLRDLG